MANNKRTAIAIMGPTASGKTALAIDLAKHFDTEVISVDSALVYRGMDIGTAKPSQQEQAGITHHLLDIRDPSETYSAAEFVRDATQCIQAIVACGKTPILVGGTMLYYKALLEGLSPLPESDPSVRAELTQQGEREGWPALHAELTAVDPKTASQLHPNHSQRISRALEVYRISGVPMSELQNRKSQGLMHDYEWVQIAIAPKMRKTLHERIAFRFEHMIELGFLEEVRQLYGRGDLSINLPAMRSVGYRQAWEYLDGSMDYDQMVASGMAATRQLAKRQMTWLRSWHDLSWLNSTDCDGSAKKKAHIFSEALNIIGNNAV